MSHFAVYALTRDVGIDIVPPAPPPPPSSLHPGLQSRHSRRDIPLRISDFAKFLQAGRVLSRHRVPRAALECQARIFWQRFRRSARGAHVERKSVLPRLSPAPKIFANPIRTNHVYYFLTIRGAADDTDTSKIGTGRYKASRLHCETGASNISR